MADPLTQFAVDPSQLTVAELGALADTFQGLKDRKTELNRLLDDVSSELERTRKLILSALEYQGVTSIGGSMARVTITSKKEPRAMSWPDLYQHILHTGEFDLLHRRIGTAAVRERWAAGIEVPGIDGVEVRDLSVSRIR